MEYGFFLCMLFVLSVFYSWSGLFCHFRCPFSFMCRSDKESNSCGLKNVFVFYIVRDEGWTMLCVILDVLSLSCVGLGTDIKQL